MKPPTTVSIIINNCNYGRFVSDAINSALAQTYPHVEVIVVDDGSTDESRHVIEGYSNRLRAIFKRNGGQSSALNAGFAASSGDLVFFLDADDTLNPTAAATVVQHWADGLVRAQFPLEAVDAAGRPSGRVIGGLEPPSATLGPFGVGSPTSGNAFLRTALRHTMPIPEEWGTFPDAYLVPTTSLFGAAMRLKEILGKYRIHGRNNVQGTTMGLPELRQAIGRQLMLHDCLRRAGGDRVGTLEEWLGAYPQHWVGRITSLRESPSDHPWPDTLAGLVRRAIMAAWRQPYWNTRRKLVYTAFVLARVGLPRKAARALRTMESHARDPVFRRLLGRGHVHA